MTTLDDSELDDLISSDVTPTGNVAPTGTGSVGNNKNKTYSSYYSPEMSTATSSSGFSPVSLLSKIPSLLTYMLMSFLIKYPRCSKSVTAILFLTILYVFVGLTTRGRVEQIGVVGYDFSTIHSQYDFDIGQIDHWCIDHSNECRCEDPLQPTAIANKSFLKSHRENMNIGSPNNIDVAIVGQSVVEALNGKHAGEDRTEESDYFNHVQHMFQKRFQSPTDDNQNLYGVAIGNAGDQANNILWRLTHGEILTSQDTNVNPSYYWIVLGMEDIARFRCSEEVVIMGILRIVEEIKNTKPDAKIIVNGLFPMMKLRTENPNAGIDFIDAERMRGPKKKGFGRNGRKDGRRRRLRNTIRRKLARHHSHKHHKHHKHGSSDEEEDSNDEEVNPKKQSKISRDAFMDSFKDKFNEIKEKHHAEEKELLHEIVDIKRSHELSKKEKHEKLDELVPTLKAMKEKHAHIEESVKKYMMAAKKDRYNPVMKEKHSFHKKKNVFHKNQKAPIRIPMWTAIHEINKQLRTFCQNTDQVTFYDPTNIFTTKTENGEFKLLTDLISPRGHPTREGYKMWMREVQERLIGFKAKAAKKEIMSKNNFKNSLKDTSFNLSDNKNNDDDEFKAALKQYYYGDDGSDADNGDHISEDIIVTKSTSKGNDGGDDHDSEEVHTKEDTVKKIEPKENAKPMGKEDMKAKEVTKEDMKAKKDIAKADKKGTEDNAVGAETDPEDEKKEYAKEGKNVNSDTDGDDDAVSGDADGDDDAVSGDDADEDDDE